MKSDYISRDDLHALGEVIETAPRTLRRAWLPFAVALETGLRIGDIVALPSSALTGRTLKFTAAKTGKTGSATLSAGLCRRIKAGKNEKWLFPSPYRGGEKHLTRQAAWARLKTAARRANLSPQGISPHSLRKVFAVELCARQGIGAVQKALQHSRVDVTEMYALADYLTPESTGKPLTRGDIPMILQLAVDAVRAGIIG